LGGDNAKEALSAVDTGNLKKQLKLPLRYYDKAYMFGINRKRSGNIFYIETDTDNIDINARKVLEAADKIKW